MKFAFWPSAGLLAISMLVYACSDSESGYVVDATPVAQVTATAEPMATPVIVESTPTATPTASPTPAPTEEPSSTFDYAGSQDDELTLEDLENLDPKPLPKLEGHCIYVELSDGRKVVMTPFSDNNGFWGWSHGSWETEITIIPKDFAGYFDPKKVDCPDE